jgi:hypothetical protein
MKEGKKLVGTPIFCSRWTHAGVCNDFAKNRTIKERRYVVMDIYDILSYYASTLGINYQPEGTIQR